MIVFHWLVCGGLSLAGLWWSLFGWAVVVSHWLGYGGLSLDGLLLGKEKRFLLSP